MARVQLLIDDPANLLTLRSILQAAGHDVVSADPEVIIVDDLRRAVTLARDHPTLVLAQASQIREAVEAMRQGVYGYLFVPLQPGEAEVMVARALGQKTAPQDEAPLSLEELEARHILATLRRCKNNRAEAARLLGIGRNTLWRKLKRIQRETRLA